MCLVRLSSVLALANGLATSLAVPACVSALLRQLPHSQRSRPAELAQRCWSTRTKHRAHRASSSDRERRSLRIWANAVVARANNFARSEATALKRTGAMALACTGQVTKMTGGMPAGLSSSMMISEPFTRALARVVDLDKAGSFPV
jgi:hypothetical protein